jgi:hypothetical protein
MKRIFHGFGGKLRHEAPHWVRDDAVFHIRIRCAPEQGTPLIAPELAHPLLDSVGYYEAKGRWWVDLFLLMPDHLHALLAFGPDQSMSELIRDWKRYHARAHGVRWQDGYFDHRLRDHDGQWRDKHHYILRNPVVKGLCAAPEDWPWKYVGGGGAPETRPEQRAR